MPPRIRKTASPAGSASTSGDGTGRDGITTTMTMTTSTAAGAGAASHQQQQPAAPRPKGRPRGFRRDRDCRTCKARNVKCDLNRPSCGICVAAGVPCQGYATTVRWANSSTHTQGHDSGAPSLPTKKSSASASRSSFSASPSCGLGPSRSPSLSQSSAPSPPDLVFKAHHQYHHQPQQPLPDQNNGHLSGIINDRASSNSIVGFPESAPPALPAVHPSHFEEQQQQQQEQQQQQQYNHNHHQQQYYHHAGTSTPDTPCLTTKLPKAADQPFIVRPDQRAHMFAAALNDNPDDSNWTTHYIKYYEFFTAQFDKARRTITKERRYRPQPQASASPGTSEHSPPTYPSVDRDLRDVWQLLWQRLSGQIPPGTTAALTSSNDDAESNTVGGSSVELLTSHTAALVTLNEAIKAGDILAIYGVVTLSFLDVYEGPFIDCQWHMHGARALLQLHCHDGPSLDALCAELAGLREAVSLLSWYDTMGFYFEQNRRNALVFPDWVRAGMRDEFFELVSCPRDAYMVYAAVVKARTAHRGNREDDGDVEMDGTTATACAGPAGDGEVKIEMKMETKMETPVPGPVQCAPRRYQEKLKLCALAVQQVMQVSDDITSPRHAHRDIKTRELHESFRYAAALIATETAHAGDDIEIDDETARTLITLTDHVCARVTSGVVPVTSGKYRHFACQVTIVGHHAKTERHRHAVAGYWTHCDKLARPIYPIGRMHSGNEEHWSRILGTSTTSSSSAS